MPLDPPSHEHGTPEEWFIYFRVTKFLPGMQEKFNEEMAFATDAVVAHRLLTAYVASCLDVVIFTRMAQMDLVTSLEMMFDMPPETLLHLNAHDIADLMSYDADFIVESLRHNGFAIGDDGHISAYTGAAPPAPPAPKPPKL